MLSLGKNLLIGVSNDQDASNCSDNIQPQSILVKICLIFPVIKSTQTQSTIQRYMLYSFYCCVLHKHVFKPNDAKEEVPAVFTD